MHKAKNIYFPLIKKNEMAQGRGWPKAEYLPLTLIFFFIYLLWYFKLSLKAFYRTDEYSE